MAAPTHEDARMMIEIMQLSTAMGMKEAATKVYAEDFDPETVDPQDDAVNTVLGFGEMVGTFVKHDLLNRELVADLMWLDGMWARVGPAALKVRERMGEPRIYENFEWLVRGSE